MIVYYFADTRFPIERANGVQTMATCRALAARGHEVTLVVRPDTAAPPRDPATFYGVTAEPRLTIKTVPAQGGPRARRIRFMLQAAAMAAQCPGVVYTRDLGLAAFLLQLPRVRRPKVVYESHGIAPIVAIEMPALLGNPDLVPSASKLARLDRRERRVWQRAAAYVTITRALADELSTRYGPRAAVFVVPDGADPAPEETMSTTPGVELPHPVSLHPLVGYAGHLYPWKGVDVLLGALVHSPHLHALIVGGHPAEADLARVQALAVSLGVADRVEFTGLVPPPMVMGQLRRASVLVLPNTASAISERYTSPLKLFEYLSAGRPIVASDLPAFREVLTHDETALLVPPGDPVALAAALDRVTADAALATALARRSRELSTHFTWDARAERLETTLRAARA